MHKVLFELGYKQVQLYLLSGKMLCNNNFILFGTY